MKYPAVGFTCLPVAVPRRTEIMVSENQLSGMTKLSHEGWGIRVAGTPAGGRVPLEIL